MRFPVLAVLLTAVVALTACTRRELILTGERLDARAIGVDAPETPPEGPRDIALPPQVTRAEWTHKAANPAHDMPHAALSARPSQVWAADIGAAEDRRHRITADPVVAGGRVYTVDSRAGVAAHTLSGQPVWRTDVTPEGEDPDDASGAGLAAAGGRLFVTTGFGDLVALDAATGRELWVQELDASAAGAPTVVDGLVYLVTRDATAWAVDAQNGRIRWTLPGTPSASGVVGGAAPAVTERLAVFPFSSRQLVGALREGGTRAWSATVAGTRQGRAYARISDISGDPVVTGGRVYAGSPTGRTAAFDLRTGEQIWSAEGGAMSPVVVGGGSVFAVSDKAELVRLDAGTGTRIWGTELPYFTRERIKKREKVFAHYGPVLAGGRLWVASTDGRLRGFDPRSGALRVEVPLPGGAATNPVVAGRTLYVVSQDGRLLAFR